ncbi:hypothetical protein O6H91_05G020000 [Diphasiastrum complanatum]|uniref:Uncharacterized protein n=1 Tax=Diphasiastrum complanatum TaxID=34168 RepID=A0ACC2DLQ6_DIPCM|nr:hypothetical protein O6H91_05G020000 [Diphasiastrum complanatum]
MPEVQTIVMKVGMHCDGCARKVRKILTHMAGVEELKVDYPGQRVTVKGTIDPKKVVHKVSKAGKAVEILEIIAEPPKPAEDAGAEPPKEAPPPEVKTIILRVMMHCEGCARKVKDVLRKIPDHIEKENIQVWRLENKVLEILEEDHGLDPCFHHQHQEGVSMMKKKKSRKKPRRSTCLKAKET